MTAHGQEHTPGRSERVARAGAEHVLLLYDYVDRADLDGCASLLDEYARLRLPGVPYSRGRRRVEAALREHLAGRGLHRVDLVRVSGEGVVAEGAFTETSRMATLVYRDVFSLSEHGLIASWDRAPR
ncbi:nuclear transport factor 2 family protein [Nocardiopsis sp. NPDC006139]|uniref:nuclear transport factor 2 family protein n=1 Tax=Nocardiopsis TaxID=2013 RepID=UPI0033B5768B